MNKSMTRLVVALIAFLLVAVVAVPIVQGVINNKQSTDIGGGKDGKDGEDGITPQLRINYSTNEWEYSYTQGVTWQSLGVKATGAAGKDGADGKDGQDGQDGKDGVSPRIRINTSTSEWEISTDEGLTWESTGVKASGEVTASLTIDSELSETSENPVQNKVITTEMMAFAAEINTAFDEVYAALDNVSVTVPTFDLVALGLPVFLMESTYVEIAIDTTEIMAALDKGPVKFIISMDNGDSTSTNVELVVNSIFTDGVFVCSQTVDFAGGYPFMFTIIVMEDVVGGFVTTLFQSESSSYELPDVTTDDDGKGLIVQGGEWVVGELPETPTQEKTIEITESGTYEITPDAGYALSKVLLDVAVAGESAGSNGGDEWISAQGSFTLDTQGTYTVSHGLGVIPDIVLVDLSVAGAVENESSGWFLVQFCGFSDNLLGSVVQETNKYGSVFLFSPLNKTLMNASVISSLEKLNATQFSGICNVTAYSMQIGTNYVSLIPGYSYNWVAYAKKPADA